MVRAVTRDDQPEGDDVSGQQMRSFDATQVTDAQDPTGLLRELCKEVTLHQELINASREEVSRHTEAIEGLTTVLQNHAEVNSSQNEAIDGLSHLIEAVMTGGGEDEDEGENSDSYENACSQNTQERFDNPDHPSLLNDDDETRQCPSVLLTAITEVIHAIIGDVAKHQSQIEKLKQQMKDLKKPGKTKK